MDSMADAVAAADSIYAVLAIGILGLYALLWRFGGELLKKMDKNTEITVEANSVAKDVATSIITNHGSKNIGEAIDRLTEWMVRHMDESQHDKDQLRSLESAFIARVIDGDNRRNNLVVRLEAMDELHREMIDRLGRIEDKLGIEDKE